MNEMNYTRNLTSLYLNQSSGIIGRDSEMESMILTLLRQEKPNILLTGESGVGKTALVHLLAELIATRTCTHWLYDYQVIEVDSNGLLAGPGYRGVTEEKFKNLIEGALSKKVILFFDEFHTVTHLGEMANGQTPGLGNTLKTYLTRPDFRVIGATTIEELPQINDPALLRRFTEVMVGEPSDEALLKICESVFVKFSRGKLKNKVDWNNVLKISKSLSGVNPDKLKNILDIAIAKAKLAEVEEFTMDYIDFAVNMLTVKGKSKVKSSVKDF